MPKKISLGHITKAEQELILRERVRIRLDTWEWSKEPFIADCQLIEMSEHAAWQAILSQPAVWHRDDLRAVYRNINHPDNTAWFMEQISQQLLDGTLKPDEVNEKLRMLPAYQPA